MRHVLKQKIYLLPKYQNLIVETDAKYLIGILNNSEKMPNITINCWIKYIRTNFFFKIIHNNNKRPLGLMDSWEGNSILEILLLRSLRMSPIMRKKISNSSERRPRGDITRIREVSWGNHLIKRFLLWRAWKRLC